MSLQEYFQMRRGADVHLRLIGKVEIDGAVLVVGDDAVTVQSTAETTMLVPFTAIQFIREPSQAFRSMLESTSTK